jgi:hypothetical protein
MECPLRIIIWYVYINPHLLHSTFYLLLSTFYFLLSHDALRHHGDKRWLRFATPKLSYTMPCAIMALATFMKPAMLAPFT